MELTNLTLILESSLLPVIENGELVEESWDKLTRALHPDQNGSPLEVHPDRVPNDNLYRDAYKACYRRFPEERQIISLAQFAVRCSYAKDINWVS